MHTFYFERLEVWQNARLLVKNIYLASTSFPEYEKYGLTSQIRRATISINLNISEGFSRQGKKDKARFINQAYSSATEVINCLILSLDLGYISDEVYSTLRNQTEFVSNQLNALHKTLTKSNDFTINDFSTNNSTNQQ